MAASANAADALAQFADADSSGDEGGDGAVAVASGGRGDAAGDKAAAVYAQVEYYFSDANLPTDNFLLAEMRKGGPQGWVQLKVIAGFNKMKKLTSGAAEVGTAIGAHLAAISNAEAEEEPLLALDDAGKRVRRTTLLPEIDFKDLYERTLVAENLPAHTSDAKGSYPSVAEVTTMFAAAGEVASVRVVDGRTAGPTSAPRAAHLYASYKIHAVVEMATVEGAKKAIAILDTGKSDNWRRQEGVRVRPILTKPWKPWMDPTYVKPKKEKKAEMIMNGEGDGEGEARGGETGAGGGDAVDRDDVPAAGSEGEAGDDGADDTPSKKGKKGKRVKFAAHVPGVHRGPRLPTPDQNFGMGRGRKLVEVLAELKLGGNSPAPPLGETAAAGEAEEG